MKMWHGAYMVKGVSNLGLGLNASRFRHIQDSIICSSCTECRTVFS